ncbi:MAG: hypothetical protein EPN85_03600, partial [Bacteroidetes bacterium]
MLTEVGTPIIKLSIQEHDGEKRLFAGFPNDKGLNAVIKEIPGARWSQSKRQWHFNLNRRVMELLKQKIADKAVLDSSILKTQWEELKGKEKQEKLSEVNEETVKAIDYFKLWMEQKRYSPQTI